MPHEHLRQGLSAHLDGELTPSERAEADRHLDGCEACRLELAALRRASLRLREAGRRPAPPGLSQAIRARVQGRPSVPPVGGRGLSYVLAVAAMTTSLLVVGKVFKPQISNAFNQIMGMISGAASSVGNSP